MVNGSGTTGQNTSNKPSKLIKQFTFGGEGGIRTLDELLTHTPLAGERLRPLGHLSGDAADLTEISKNGALGGSRTPDLLVRSQTLYPAELPAHRNRIIGLRLSDLQPTMLLIA